MIELFEIVPNISAGKDRRLIDDAVRVVQDTGARVLHRTSDAIHHRSVLTIVGEAEPILDAAVALAEFTTARVDLRTHHGVHPRIGALDVLPFVPLRGAAMATAIALAHNAGERIWQRCGVPAFYYGEAALQPSRRLLATVRRGEFEGLESRPDLPDTGRDVRLHPSAGAIAIGARSLLVAFNIVLNTGDVEAAKQIAGLIRERNGGFRTLRALGFGLDERHVQVSLNITDFHATPIALIVETVRLLAAREKIDIAYCEPIGLLPRDAVADAANTYLGVS